MAQGQAPTPSSDTIVLTPAQTGPFENGMTILLNTWPALSLAVEQEFGGPDSADKRDWMCGAVADLFTSTPATDAEDLESFLLQILEDEFETALEDDSAYIVSQRILLLRQQCSSNDFSGVETLQGIWARIGKNKAKVQVVREDSDSDDEEEGEDEMDVDMDEAPQLVAVKERVEKVVDEDGFELVQKKGKRTAR
ncbi:hypothetical protein ABW19_dt0202344 [Dactylella cylindrospora]|nr:hypothetical protein ABW19_dt0202344 [Dactylella cylindrospora]